MSHLHFLDISINLYVSSSPVYNGSSCILIGLIFDGMVWILRFLGKACYGLWAIIQCSSNMVIFWRRFYYNFSLLFYILERFFTKELFHSCLLDLKWLCYYGQRRNIIKNESLSESLRSVNGLYTGILLLLQGNNQLFYSDLAHCAMA